MDQTYTQEAVALSPHSPRMAAGPLSEAAAARPALFRRGGTIHELFASCVRRFPSAIALVHGEAALTYAELDALSDHYAAALERAAVGRGDFVPVIMKRSPEMVAVLLAVLKRGAAYAALDPGWPRARLSALAGRLRPPVVVTGLPGPWPAHTWSAPPRSRATAANRPGQVDVGPDDPCTIFFTSGSTGDPKAVVSLHRGTVRLFDSCEWLGLGPGVTMPQVSAVSWDGFMLDCWGPLLTGGTIVLVNEPILVPGALRQLVDKHGVNAVFLTTSLFNMLVDEGVEAFAGIHTVVIGGEKASPSHARGFLEKHSGTRLVNIYGPAECTVLVAAHTISLPDCNAPEGIPLGTTIPHTGIHILDGTRSSGNGEIGEICVSGAGLADGYLGDPALTARRFAATEIDGVNVRIYRTGDLGHWSADGTLRFDGRIDRQLKMHGYRIEPEEIELAASQIPGVTTSVVVPLRREGMVDALALLYADAGRQIPRAELRAELRTRLPGYLVPDVIQRLETFPLLPNGKLDRLLLETMINSTDAVLQPGEDQAGKDPQGAAEITVAEIFSGVLGVATVPRDVSFFDLGGNSLSAARVCARLEHAIGTRVQVSQLFRTPAVAQLARWCDAASHAGSTLRPPAAEERTGNRHVELTPMQALMATSAMVNDLAWWVDGTVDEDVLARAATDVHRRHQALHVHYIASGANEGHAVLPRDPGEAQFCRLPAAHTDAAALAALRAALNEPLRIDDGEVWRCAFVRSMTTGRSLFGVAVHHLAFDGRSAAILTRELSTAYAARITGSDPEFGARAGSLAEFQADYREQLAATDVDGQRRYWLGDLRRLQPCHLPGRSPGQAPVMGTAAAAAFTMQPAQLRDWQAYGQNRGMTAFVWIAAAYAEALIRAGAPRDLGLLVPVAKRGSSLLDSSIVCRMGSACLRPNGPNRKGQHLLARMLDAYHKAMAAQDIFLDFKEVARAVGARWEDTAILRAMPVLLYQDDEAPVLSLGDATATAAQEMDTWTSSSVELCLEVRPSPAGSVMLRVAVRDDIYPAELAGDIGRLLLEIIGDGPVRLERQTTRAAPWR